VPDKTEFNQIFGEGMLRTERALKFVSAHTISTVIPRFSSIEEIEAAAKVGREFVGLISQEVKDIRFCELPPLASCLLCHFVAGADSACLVQKV